MVDTLALPFINDSWNDKLIWEDINPKDMKNVYTIYEELLNEMISCLNSIYSNILTSIKNQNTFSKIFENMKNFEPNSVNYHTCSGIVDNHFMSNRIIRTTSGSNVGFEIKTNKGDVNNNC